MIDIEQILSGDSAADIISSLRERTTTVTAWKELRKEYEPSEHEIVEDTSSRKNKIHEDGSKDEAARIPFGLEKLTTQRMSELMFSIPVHRKYSTDGEKQEEIAKSIEAIYKNAHINNINLRRGVQLFASCEHMSLWYVKKGDRVHNLYGFPTPYKLRCKDLSPMDGVKLFPLIDEYGEMYAMSYEYRKKVKDTWVTFFETFTKDKHFSWRAIDGANWEPYEEEKAVVIGKIPCIYINRDAPLWAGLVPLRKDIEYSVSRNSDVLAYNSAPVLKVAGTIIGDEKKGETRRVYRVMEGGDVSYVSWNQSVQALNYHVSTLRSMWFMLSQVPDLSFENMSKLGNIGYDARKMMLTDAHMKVGMESGAWLEFFEREGNVVKAFLKWLNTSYSPDDIDAVGIEHEITPYVQEDRDGEIDRWFKASGNKPLVSQREAIQGAGLSKDPDKTLEDIRLETATAAAAAAVGAT